MEKQVVPVMIISCFHRGNKLKKHPFATFPYEYLCKSDQMIKLFYIISI